MNKNNKNSIPLKFEDASKDEKRKIQKMVSMPQIWDFDDIREKIKEFSKQQKLNSESNKIKKNEGGEHYSNHTYLYRRAERTTLDELYHFLKIAGFEIILETESISDYDVNHEFNYISKKNPRSERRIIAAHPSGILLKGSTYGKNKDGKREVETLQVHSQIDLGMGNLSFLSHLRIVNPGSSSSDFQRHGGMVKTLSSTNTSLGKCLPECINHLESVQKAGKIKKISDWDTSWMVFNLSPTSIIDVNANTYSDIGKKDTAEKIVNDTFDFMKDFISNNKNHKLKRKTDKIPGLDNILKFCFFSYGNKHSGISRSDYMQSVFREKAYNEYNADMICIDEDIYNRTSSNNNNNLSFHLKQFDWKLFEDGLLELDTYGFENHIRYLNDKDKKTLSGWINFMEELFKNKNENDDIKKYYENIDVEKIKNSGCYEKLEGGFDFPSFLISHVYKNVMINYQFDYYHLLMSVLNKASDDYIKDICSSFDLSGKTFPMKVIDHASRSGYRNTLFSPEKKYSEKIKENTGELIDYLISRVENDDIILSTDKYSPNGLWMKNFIDAIENKETPVNYLSYKNTIDRFEKHGVNVDKSWDFFKAVKLISDKDMIDSTYKIKGSKQIRGNTLEDIINEIDEIKNNPEVVKIILKEGIVNMSQNKKHEEKPALKKRKI